MGSQVDWAHVLTNQISASSAPIAGFGDKEYYDLIGTLEVLKKIFKESAVDGFELQLEPEWDQKNPPLTDVDWADWTKTPKYGVEKIVELVKQAKVPILSVHASRDVGRYLCSGRKKDLRKGENLIHESLQITESLDAEVCVFHLWDTWKTSFNIESLEKMFQECAGQFPKVKGSVENIPTHLGGSTPFELVKCFEYVTLDTRWAALYKELDKFESVAKKIVNVHLRGSLKGDEWFVEQSNFGFYEALDKIKREWKYSRLFTVEPEGTIEGSMFADFIRAMRSLKKHLD
jgi:hypothetical protein